MMNESSPFNLKAVWTSQIASGITTPSASRGLNGQFFGCR